MARIKSRKTYSVSRHRHLGGKLRLATGLGVLIIIILILELTNTTHIFHKEKIPPVIPITQKHSVPSESSNSTPTSSAKNSTQSTVANDKSPAAAASSNAPLVAPYGSLVSNHAPGQDGSTTAEQSACDTTPGAVCYIKFTDGSITTQLPSQTVGSDGSTIWNWDINKDAHLSSGKWQVTAVATLNGQTQTTTDQIPLVVQ